MHMPGRSYFGEPWSYECSDPIVVPTDRSCSWCSIVIGPDDRGFIEPCVRISGEFLILPIHRECHLRRGVGGLNHLLHRCSCYGYKDAYWPTTPQELREEALQIWSLLWQEEANR